VDAKAHLQRALSSSAQAALHVVGAVARDSGFTAYLVGGPVRDALLGRDIVDLDVSVEGDAIALAGSLAARHGAVVDKTHEAFGTATVTLANGSQVDLATSRSETYEQPAALPAVVPAGIHQDLLRRDFTINAMAAPLAPDGFGEIVDPCGGVADITARRIRILHPDSFVDDPTRIFRAVKFARRFDFALDEGTAGAARRAASSGVVALLTGARVRNELAAALREEEPVSVLAGLHDLGALTALTIPFPFDEDTRAFVARAATFVAPSDADRQRSLLIAWLDWMESDAAALMAWLMLPGEFARDVGSVSAVAEALADRAPAALKPSEWHPLLAGACPDILPALGARYGASAHAELVAHYHRFASLRPFVTGDDLRDLGYEPGPGLGAILRLVFDAQLDGRVEDREAAVRLARRYPDTRPR